MVYDIAHYLQRLEGFETPEDFKRLVQSRDREDQMLGIFSVGYALPFETKLRNVYLLLGMGELPTVCLSPMRIKFWSGQAAPIGAGETRLRIRDKRVWRTDFDLRAVGRYMEASLPAPEYTTRIKGRRIDMSRDDWAVLAVDRALTQVGAQEELLELTDD